jgi:hypothetical protein
MTSGDKITDKKNIFRFFSVELINRVQVYTNIKS